MADEIASLTPMHPPSLLRVLADGLINYAETRPRRSDSAGMLRDAAASLLDADAAIEREDATPAPRPGAPST